MKNQFLSFSLLGTAAAHGPMMAVMKLAAAAIFVPPQKAARRVAAPATLTQ